MRPKLERRVERALESVALRDARADTPRRRIDIVRVDGADDEYRFVARTDVALPAPQPNAEVLQALPRREQASVEIAGDLGPPPLRRSIVPHAGFFETLGRLLVWLRALAYFVGGNFWDWLRRRDTDDR